MASGDPVAEMFPISAAWNMKVLFRVRVALTVRRGRSTSKHGLKGLDMPDAEMGNISATGYRTCEGGKAHPTPRLGNPGYVEAAAAVPWAMNLVAL